MGGSRRTGIVIIGGGHNGLAMSRQLSDRGVEHAVLERGEVANAWRTQRWDSFTLLTPNWQSCLPGQAYEGDDPDGYMNGPQIVEFLDRYADVVDAPIHTGTSVTAVRSDGAGGYLIDTDDGPWQAGGVVLAAGACNLLNRPSCAAGVPPGIDQVNPLDYRAPEQLADGGVLVVGAAATGVQLAEEIHASGRPVTLAVGEHVRMPRIYRGRDIQHWLTAIGRLDERYDEVEEIVKARKGASPQLIGTPERRTLDLNALTDAGVRLRGRLGTIRDGVAMFSGGLRNQCALADQKLTRLLDEIDTWIDEHGLAGAVAPAERFEPTRVERGTPLTLDLGSGEIRSIVWATGFRPDLSWLDLPVFDAAGNLRHDGGVVQDASAVCTVGATFLRRRSSSFIHGASSDTAELADVLVAQLAANHGGL